MASASDTKRPDAYVMTDQDRLLRETFAIGFVILLVLVAGLGVLSVRRIGAVEEAITGRSAANRQTLEVVFQLEEETGLLAAEGKTLLTARTASLRTGPAERRIAAVQKDLDETLERGRALDVGSTAEWREFERALTAYSTGLASPEPNSDDVNASFSDAMRGLRELAQREDQRLSDDADAMRRQAQRDIAIATAACLAVGLLVSALAFIETRRRIRQLRHAYRSVEYTRQIIEGTLEGMTSAVLTVDRDGVVTRINGHALDILGLKRAGDAIGHPIGSLVSGRALRQALEPLARGGPIAAGYVGRFALGTDQRLYDVGVAELLIARETSGHIVTLTDVTEAERANEELRRSRALAAVGQMTAQVAHEIKNPLGSVGLAAQVLEQRLAGDEVSRDVVRRIESSVDHLTRIASELNQFARPTELNLTMVDPAALLDDVLAAVADRVLERQVRLACTRVKPIPRARLDQKEVRKVMLNVLINAVDASEPEGSIEVSLGLSSDTADRLVFSVVDHGEGMDDETAQRLFEPFFTTKARGTGLGMAITRNIVELHGGEISVESAVGEGTTVTVTLPVDAAVRRATTHAEGA